MLWEVIGNHIKGVQKASQIYPLCPPPFGSNWSQNNADFVFLSCSPFIIAFKAFKFIGVGGVKPPSHLGVS